MSHEANGTSIAAAAEAPTALIADPLAPAAEDVLKEAGLRVRRVAGRRRAELLAAVRSADALLVRSATTVDEEVLDQAPRLKVVARAGVGVDNIDVRSAEQRGVSVVNTPSANVHSACEHAIALLLSAARHVPAANASTHSGAWERSRFQGVEIYGKTVGVVGFGRVGQLFAERMRAFGAEVVAADPYADPEAAQRLGVRLVPFDELVATADFVSIHVPKTAETTGLFNAAVLSGAKPGQIIVNTSRGGVIEEHALAEALREGPIRAAGIDVFESEPPQNSPLIGLPNVVLTPHLGASTSEAQHRAGVEAAEAVVAALGGGRN